MSKLPCKECKGKCCNPPSVTLKELKAIKKKHKLPKHAQLTRFENLYHNCYPPEVYKELVNIASSESNMCPFLEKSGSCGIYDTRPKVCREYGIKESMPCEYLYPKKAKAAENKMLAEATRLSIKETENEVMKHQKAIKRASLIRRLDV